MFNISDNPISDYINSVTQYNQQLLQQESQISLVSKIQSLNDNLSTIVDVFKKIGYFANNPIMLVKAVVVGLANASFYICVLIVMWSIIIYVLSENKKVKEVGYLSSGVYCLLQVLGYCFKGL